MFLGPLEIFLCLAPFMIIMLTIGAGLLAQNIAIKRRELERNTRKCPNCQKLLNPEAYVCRFCRKELHEYSHVQK